MGKQNMPGIKNKRILLRSILVIILCRLSIVGSFAQDRPAAKPPLLPFQTTAQQTTDDQLAMQFFQARDYEKAAAIYEKLYETKPAQYYTYYLFCLVEIHDYEHAEKLIKSARKADPDAPKYLVDLGYVYYRQGNVEKAKKLYEDALKNLGANQQQVYELANAFIMRNENDYAVKTYLRGRELLKNTYNFSFELSGIYERTGNYKEMIEEYLNLIDFNPTYLATVEDRLQSSLADDPENAKNEIFRKAVLSRAQKEPDKQYYSELLWWYSVQQKDFGMALIQAKSLDRRLREDGSRIMQLSKLCVSNGNYDVAIEGYEYLVAKGPGSPLYTTAKAELLSTRYYKAVSVPNPTRKELTVLEKEFMTELQEMGINNQSISLVKNLAHLDAFYLEKTDEAIDQLNRVIDMPDIQPQVKAECKLDLADILVFSNDVWDAMLLYEQVYKDFKNDAIGQLAKFKNAKLSYYIGEFAWARAQLDILKAATSKLIANDAMDLSLLISENYDSDSSTVALGYYARADLLDFRNEDDLALATLDSIPMHFKEHPIMDQMLMKEARIKMKQGKYTDADTLLGTLVHDYSTDILADEALFTRGRLNEEQLMNKEKAMACYGQLMNDYPGSIYVVEARKRFRTLRGDKIQ
jgi:tetratricopeptide (TPR) repeat protein